MNLFEAKADNVVEVKIFNTEWTEVSEDYTVEIFLSKKRFIGVRNRAYKTSISI